MLLILQILFFYTVYLLYDLHNKLHGLLCVYKDTLQYRLEGSVLPLASDIEPSHLISTLHL